MAAKYKINLSGAPLTTTVLNAKRYRLETRWRECLMATVVLGMAVCIALWFCIDEQGVGANSVGAALTGLLTMLLLCAVHALFENYAARRGLLMATEIQREQVEAARALPDVARYLRAVADDRRSLSRNEAAAIIVYHQRQPRRVIPRQSASHAEH